MPNSAKISYFHKFDSCFFQLRLDGSQWKCSYSRDLCSLRSSLLINAYGPSSLSPIQGSGSLRKNPFPNKLPPFQSRSRTFSRFRFPRLKLFLLLLLFFKRHSILLSNANIWESGNLLRSDRNKLQRSSIQRNKPERESSATGKKIGIKFRLRTEKKRKTFST